MEETVKAKARERQEATQFGGGGKISTTGEKARDELGAMAGVSGKTYEHAAAVIESAPAPFPLRLTRLLSVTVSE